MTFYGRKMEWFVLCRILARDLKSWRVIGYLSIRLASHKNQHVSREVLVLYPEQSDVG